MVTSLLARLRIGTKVLLIAGLALLGFVAVLITLFVADGMRSRVDAIQQAALTEYMTVQSISEDFLNARRREKDFLLRKDQSYADKHAEVSAKIEAEITGLMPQAAPTEAEKLKQIQALYGQYDTQFRAIAGDITAMGLKPTRACSASSAPRCIRSRIR